MTPPQDPQWTASDRWGEATDPDRPGSEAVDRLLRQVSELREYATYWMMARADGVKSSIRRVGLLVGLGFVALLAGATVAVMTIVLLMVGMSDGLTRLFGGRQWLGELVTGGFFLIALTWGLFLVWSRTTRAWRKAMVKKYEQRKDRQRERFGRDVVAQAAQSHTRS